MSLVVRTTTKLVAPPFLVTYGAYLTIYGYESPPGGGFQAGVIFAVSVILLMTAYGYRRTRKHFPLMTVQLVESSAALFIVGVALMGAGLRVLLPQLPPPPLHPPRRHHNDVQHRRCPQGGNILHPRLLHPFEVG
ncbi:MnhB domain-containing protein [Thermococcus peptonophilus]|uniref:MnhB domain-containing protein n=1 Tax=Thermococcus peptonophilus TaxID=53952 RepID=UPI003465DDFD